MGEYSLHTRVKRIVNQVLYRLIPNFAENTGEQTAPLLNAYILTILEKGLILNCETVMKPYQVRTNSQKSL